METIYWINKAGYEIKQVPIIFEIEIKVNQKYQKLSRLEHLKIYLL